MSFGRPLGVALLSGAGLALEIAFVRVLSVGHGYAFVFVALSVALLGLGIGAALASLSAWVRHTGRLGLLSACAAASTLLLVLASATGVAPQVLVVLAVAPYAFAGAAFAGVFAADPDGSPRIYRADLFGAGAGALLTLPLLNGLGGIGGMAASAGIFALAGVAFVPRRRTMLAGALLGLLAVAAAVPPVRTALETTLAQRATGKPIHAQLQAGGVLAATRWDAFSRTDLVFRPDQNAHYLYMDGGAGSLVPTDGNAGVWRRDIGALAFDAARAERALLLGAGGGLDVALALDAGVPDVTAVELNRASVELTRARTGDALYGGDVTVLVAEGRDAVRRSSEPFDLVFLSHVVTQTADLRGYAHAENRVYTVEAFREYLAALTPGGVLAIKLYDEPTLTRAFLTVVTALTPSAGSESAAAQHLLAFVDTRGARPVPLLLAYANAPDRNEIVRVARAAERGGFALLYLPELLAPDALVGLVEGRSSVAELASAGALDLRPTTDDRPFFFAFERRAEPALLVLLALAVLLLVVITVAWARHPAGTAARAWRGAPLAFVALGFGFMTLEVAVLQRAQAFVPHPTVALVATLAALLLAGGAGSRIAQSAPAGRERRWITWASAAAMFCAVAWFLVAPAVADAVAPRGDGVRLALFVVGLLPLGIALGVPFPLALRSVGRDGPRSVAAAWASNGAAAVVGAVAATLLSHAAGLPVVAAFGVFAYACVGLSSVRWSTRQAAVPPAGDGRPDAVPAPDAPAA